MSNSPIQFVSRSLQFASGVLSVPSAYELWAKVHLPPRIKLILEMTKLKAGQSILELGCGPGTARSYLHEYAYSGIDLSDEYIAYAKRRFNGKNALKYPTEFILGDVCTPKAFPSLLKKFDLVLLNGCLHHLPPEIAAGALESMASFAKTGGMAMIVDQIWPEPGENSFPRANLIRLDRGKFTKTGPEIEQMMASRFKSIRTNHVNVGLPGMTFWRYFGALGET